MLLEDSCANADLCAVSIEDTGICVYIYIYMFPPPEAAAWRGRRRVKLESVGGSLPWEPRETILQLSVVALMVEGFRGPPPRRCVPHKVRSSLRSSPQLLSSWWEECSAVLGPVDGRNDRPAVSPWSVSLIVISFGDTAAGAAKLLLLLLQ